MDAIERALEILGLAPDATPEDVKQAYRDMTKVWHPDRFPNDSRVRRKAEEKLKEINGAYEILRGYDPASRVRPRPHGGPSARRNPAQNHQRTEAPKRGSSSPPFEPSGKKKPASPAAESRSGVAPWAYIIGAILAILVVRYFMEAPKTETRPRPPDVTYAPSIPTPSPAPEVRERTSPPAPEPPPTQDRKEEKDRLAANARRDLKRYRDTLGPVLQAYERELARQIELHKARKDLYEKGAISAAEVRAGERALAASQKNVDDTRQAIEEADRMMGEIELAPQGAEGKPRVPR